MTGHYFSPCRIAELAMKVEEAGAGFYATLADMAGAGGLKDIFLALAQAEMNHRTTFQSLADSLRKEEVKEYSVDISLLMQTQLDKLEEAAFSMQSFSKSPTTIPVAMDIAIRGEEEAVRIYTSQAKKL